MASLRESLKKCYDFVLHAVIALSLLRASPMVPKYEPKKLHYKKTKANLNLVGKTDAKLQSKIKRIFIDIGKHW